MTPATPTESARAFGSSRSGSLVAACLLLAAASLATAAEPINKHYDLPAASADKSLKQFSEQAGLEVIFSTKIARAVKTNPVKGEMTARQALDAMLSGTLLVIVQDRKSGAFTVTQASDPKGARESQSAPRESADESSKKKESQTSPAHEPMKRNKFLSQLTATLALVFTPAAPAKAQTVPASNNSASSSAEEKAIELTPFTVSAVQDVGYLAGNTLAGSRMNTPLKDTAASISVLTREFLNDLAATDLSEALVFANNLQLNNSDEGNFTLGFDGNSLMEFNQRYRVRGISAQVARNYFRWENPTDTYNVGRVEDSRGPNSVLFGIGSAGGVINVATKQAELRQTIRDVSLGIDSHSSRRVTLDFNQPLGSKAAIRVNALWNDQKYGIRYAFAKSQRLHLAVKYRFAEKWQIRAEYEKGEIEANRGRNAGTFDFVLPWLAAGRPTFGLTAPATAFAGLGSRLGANQPRYISNSNQLMSMTGQLVTTGSGAPITDPKIADFLIGAGGPGQVRENPYNSYAAFVEGQLGRKTSMEVAFNRQSYDYESVDPATAHRLFADANTTLPDGTPNPNAGRLFMESQWRLMKRAEESDTARITLSTEFDAGKWGVYRGAILGEYEQREFRNGNRFEIMAGRPFSTDPIAPAHRFIRRTYVTEGDWASYWVNSPRLTGLINNMTDPITGRTFSTTFDYPQAANDDPTEQRPVPS